MYNFLLQKGKYINDTILNHDEWLSIKYNTWSARVCVD